MSDWISVDDEMPEEEELYLCYFSDGTVETYPAVWNYRGSPIFESVEVLGSAVFVTHWQNLPEGPK